MNLKDYITKNSITAESGHLRMCNCIGPQNGQPLCPCQMAGVVIKNGRYVMPERDLGPAPEARSPLCDPMK